MRTETNGLAGWDRSAQVWWPSVPRTSIGQNPRMYRSVQGRSFRRAPLVIHQLSERPSVFKLVEMQN